MSPIFLVLGFLGVCWAAPTGILVIGGPGMAPTDNLLYNLMMSQGLASVNVTRMVAFTTITATDVVVVVSSSVPNIAPPAFLKDTALPILTLHGRTALDLKLQTTNNTCAPSTDITDFAVPDFGPSPHPIMQVSGNTGTFSVTTFAATFSYIGTNYNAPGNAGLSAGICADRQQTVFVTGKGDQRSDATRSPAIRVFLGWPSTLGTTNLTTPGVRLLRAAYQYVARQANYYSFVPSVTMTSGTVLQFVPFKISFNITDSKNNSVTSDMQGATMSLMLYKTCPTDLLYGVLAQATVTGSQVTFNAAVNIYEDDSSTYGLTAVCTDSTFPGCGKSTTSSKTFRIIGPGSCTNLYADSVTKTSFCAKWTTGLQGATDISSSVFTGPTSNGPWTFYTSYSDQGDVAAPFSGLSPGTTYYVLVQVQSSSFPANANNSCNIYAATTLPDVPDAPNAPTGIVTDRSVQLQWNTPVAHGCTITNYTIFSGMGSIIGVSTQMAFNHTGLTQNTNYTYRISASNCVGMSGLSGLSSFITGGVPSQVARPTLSLQGAVNISVQWVQPAVLGGTLRAYILQYRAAGTPEFQNISVAGTHFVLFDLTPATPYEVRVAATNEYGWGIFSVLSNLTTNATAPSSPLTPTFSAVSQTSITITWQAPDANGLTIDGYQLWFHDPSTNVYALLEDDLVLTFQHTSLTGATAYTYVVRAHNAFGYGPFSDPGVQSTLADAVDDCIGVYCIGSQSRCQDGIGNYTCICGPAQWWKGGGVNTNCTNAACDGVDCGGQSTCTAGYQTYTCNCQPGWVGGGVMTPCTQAPGTSTSTSTTSGGSSTTSDSGTSSTTADSTGETAKITAPPRETTAALPEGTIIIIGAVVGAVVLIGLIVAVLLVLRTRRRRRNKHVVSSTSSTSHSTTPTTAAPASPGSQSLLG